ncbi:TPA: class I tRNA ligase family protein [Yersinia enterocolitica]
MKKYLLVSAMPTPNGGLHLGHLAAQFIPQDIFKRYQQRKGNIVTFFGGFDVYDNAISVAAKKNNVSTYEMAIHYQDKIKKELDYFNINIDILINYLEPELVKKSRHIINKLSDELNIFISTQKIPYPYSSNDIPLTGNWLVGKCKKCHYATKGYSCDNCGISITPNDIYDVSFERSHLSQKISWKDKEISFLSIPPFDLTNYISSQPISDDIKNICYNLNKKKCNSYQWTAIDQWGIFLNKDIEDEVFFNRNFTLIEQMIVADIFNEIYGENPFSKDSNVSTILAYGKDNVGLLLVDLSHIAFGTNILEPYKQHWVSHFYCINGQKMSTSKNFAIWLDDIISNEISSDGTRVYICSEFSRDKDTDLNLETLREHDRFCTDLKKGILNINNIEQNDSGKNDLVNTMKNIAGKVDNLFSNTHVDLKEYYNNYKEFCSLIYYLNCKKSAILWVHLLDEHFSALVPDIVIFAKENLNFHVKTFK